VPGLGTMKLQALDAAKIEGFLAELGRHGLAAKHAATSPVSCRKRSTTHAAGS
jgi:hypothetical protein